MTKFIQETQIDTDGELTEVLTIIHNDTVITVEETDDGTVEFTANGQTEEVKLGEVKEYLQRKFSMGFWVADAIENKLYKLVR